MTYCNARFHFFSLEKTYIYIYTVYIYILMDNMITLNIHVCIYIYIYILMDNMITLNIYVYIHTDGKHDYINLLHTIQRTIYKCTASQSYGKSK